MELGTLLPLGDIGGSPAALKEYAQAAEDAGFDFIEAPDHVVGVNPTTHPEERMSAGLYHDPFALFSFFTGVTPKLGFSTGVLILAQRQTTLVAKQAACLDVLCGGRFRLGVGVGWNEPEFVALNENFHNRGRRSEEQVQVMQKLWAEDHVVFKGKWHTIDDAGINPRPLSGKVPIWFGGHHERTLERIAKWGDGWMPNAYPADQSALDIFATLRKLTEQAGRGLIPTSSSVCHLPWNVTNGSAHNFCMTCTCSSERRPRLWKFSLRPVNSTSFHPTPMPSRNRPLDSTSRQAACLATSTVWRCGRIRTPVEKPSLCVQPAR